MINNEVNNHRIALNWKILKLKYVVRVDSIFHQSDVHLFVVMCLFCFLLMDVTFKTIASIYRGVIMLWGTFSKENRAQKRWSSLIVVPALFA